jgi:hypothetical protein
MPHILPISLFSILSPEQYLLCSTDHSSPHYAVFSTPITSSLLGQNILLSNLFSNTFSLLKNIQISVKHNCLLLSVMDVATCFDSKESSSGYYMNHNIDIYIYIYIYISNGSAHLGSQKFT